MEAVFIAYCLHLRNQDALRPQQPRTHSTASRASVSSSDGACSGGSGSSSDSDNSDTDSDCDSSSGNEGGSDIDSDLDLDDEGCLSLRPVPFCPLAPFSERCVELYVERHCPQEELGDLSGDPLEDSYCSSVGSGAEGEIDMLSYPSTASSGVLGSGICTNAYHGPTRVCVHEHEWGAHNPMGFRLRDREIVTTYQLDELLLRLETRICDCDDSQDIDKDGDLGTGGRGWGARKRKGEEGR